MVKLPAKYDKLYHSEYLKERIADESLWALIPGVNPDINSTAGAKRMTANAPLFSFIDSYFPDGPFAFEPNMRDGRFVFLPAVVDHQGIGICASTEFPGLLDIGHFWYPWEYTEQDTVFSIDQVWVCMYRTNAFEELAEMVKSLYFNPNKEKLCSFPFGPNNVVTLEGDFLDKINQSIRKIRAELKNADEMVQRNGEGLIDFMKMVMGK